MKITPHDKTNKQTLKGDVSLCKIKVKPKGKVSHHLKEPPKLIDTDDEHVQRYVIASKKRTVVLQFESPIQRRKQAKKAQHAPEGAVRGIKNLSPIKLNSKNKRVIVTKEDKPALEGKFIEFDTNAYEEPGALGDGSFDKPSVEHDENGVDEEEWVDLDEDDNYYRSFLKSIQCRVSVMNLFPKQEGGAGETESRQDSNTKTYSKMMGMNIEEKEPMENRDVDQESKNDPYVNMEPEEEPEPEPEPILRNWSGEHYIPDNYNTSDEKVNITNDSTENVNEVIESKESKEIHSDNEDNESSGEDDVDIQENKTKRVTGWLLLDNWIGGAMNYNACGNQLTCVDVTCEDKYKCGPTEEFPQEFPREAPPPEEDSEDEMSEESLDPPTALYAAVGTRNWNVALRRLLEAPEEAAMWISSGISSNGTVIQFLPLHIACLTDAPLMLLTLLVQAYPEGVKMETMGKLPLHMACEAQVDHRIAFLLLNTYPESINIRDDEENTPINIASLALSSPERTKIIQILTKRMENTVVTRPTRLYDAIDSQDWNSAIRRLVEKPQESTVWVSFRKRNSEIRFLPLHIACLMRAPLLLVADLIQAYPDAARKKTFQGKLALHIACEAHVDYRIVELLIEQYPNAMHMKDGDGNTPLDVTKGTDLSPERSSIIEVLMEKLESPEEHLVFSPTKVYSLILQKDWDHAVRRVLEAPDEASTWVGANQKRSAAKYLPLHLACSMRAPLTLVAVLIQSYPDGAQQKTSSGKLPVHLACEKRADHRIVSLLIHTWPDSLGIRDDNGQTCVQAALLSKPGEKRTKIVEALMAFEKGEGDSLMVSDIAKTIQEENKNKQQFDHDEFEDEKLQEENKRKKSVNTNKKNRATDNRPNIHSKKKDREKKGLFQRRKPKNESSDMFIT
mmetsp:Transcript_25816/g.31829  ORF Transcript_25816/g.31829 Transcript_25816/m.31829 type:complete len:904 (-) Transcript_25816:195-2906(-)